MKADIIKKVKGCGYVGWNGEGDMLICGEDGVTCDECDRKKKLGLEEK